jgi:transposase
MMQTIKVAHFRLAYSGQRLAAYPHEAQEMGWNAYSKAFTYFGGVPKRMLYDNLKMAVYSNGWV